MEYLAEFQPYKRTCLRNLHFICNIPTLDAGLVVQLCSQLQVFPEENKQTLISQQILTEICKLSFSLIFPHLKKHTLSLIKARLLINTVSDFTTVLRHVMRLLCNFLIRRLCNTALKSHISPIACLLLKVKNSF